MAPNDVFSEEELSKIHKLNSKVLPTKNDCLLYVLTRTRHGNANYETVVNHLAKEVENIWKKADCCPFAMKSIIKAFKSEVWEKYKYMLREKVLPGSSSLTKRSHKKDNSQPKKPKQPKRKSSRLNNTMSNDIVSIIEDEEGRSVEGGEEIIKEKETIQKKETRKSVSVSPLREMWSSFGMNLFDVKSNSKLKRGLLCFDSSFYEDQCGERKHEMYLSKVTKEFIEQEKARKKTEAIVERNKISALGNSKQLVDGTEEDFSDGDGDDDDSDRENMEEEIELDFPSEINVSYSTRQNSKRSVFGINQSTQTENTVARVPVRMMNETGKSNLIESRYLEAMSLLMSDGLSASEAIRAVYNLDTVVWKQNRHLPLRLDKPYMKAFKRLKKLLSQQKHNKERENEPFPLGDSQIDLETDVVGMISQQVTLVENDAINTVTNADFILEEGTKSPEIEKLKEFVSQKIKERSDDWENTLPDVSCVRHNHNLLAVYCEGKIAEELISKKGFIMPDGTSRQGVGDIAATITKTGDKFRALKSVQITKGTTNNWANAVVYMLKRLANASHSEVSAIWESVSAIISDLCKVNKSLAVEIKEMIGSTWQPGQGFCNLHFTLAVPVAIKSVLASYQTYIGADKLFPKTVGFEMNLEDKLIVIQNLDCWMRLTSIRWQSRAWNKYKSFTDFAEKRGIQNVGHMMHANRFGEFEERCAGGIYLVDTWLEWLSKFKDIRNQLACYLREVASLADQCKFLWAGAALIGLHLTVPFMSMLLDHRVTPRQLLSILPKLYDDLKSYPETLCRVDDCGIPSMKPYFLNPLVKETSPYGCNVCVTLANYLLTIDSTLMDVYLRKLCSTIGDALKRQRGDQYGFGDNPDSGELVTKNLPDEILDDSDASHTKPVENYYGNFDREIKKSGAQGFDKVSDDLIIKYSKDLIDDGHKWRTKANRKNAVELKLLQNDFNKKQKELVSLGVDEEDAFELAHENKVLKCISMCKKNHGGPLTSTDELKELIQSWKGTDKQLHTSLNYEIRLRKLTLTQVKADCSLFKQQNLTIEEKEKNLYSLINSQLDFKTLAEMSDLEQAILGGSRNDQGIPSDALCENTFPETQQSQNSISEPSNNNDIWPPKVGEYVFGLFDDGISPGEVKEVTADSVNIDILVPAKAPNMDMNESLWKRPSLTMNYNYTLHRNSILPFYPVMVINRYSTHRVLIYQVVNFDLAERFI